MPPLQWRRSASRQPLPPHRCLLRHVRRPPCESKRPTGRQNRASWGFASISPLTLPLLPQSGVDFVGRIAELMKETPALRLRVEGHTDAQGTPEYNLGLSKRRALAVAEYLVDHYDVAPERVVLVGKGMSEPMVGDGSDPRDRRVQFVRMS